MFDFLLASVHLDPIGIIQTGSYFGVAFIIFAESGLLIGIFFPGDSLLFAAGLLSAAGFFAPLPLIALVVFAAIIGDSVGYWFGVKAGPALFRREDSRFFKQEYLKRTELFYQKYGGRAVVLARFVPIVRTLAPVLAGIGTMKYSTFLRYNVLGGCLWGAGMVSLGYFLGSLIPNSERYILPISLVIIVLSFLPILINLARGKRAV
ncbi:MAG: VTT domain-containing protein [bacterium]|nr:VTT domain-containing protein [bacterium]